MDALNRLVSEQFLLELILKGTVLMAAAFAVTFVLQRASAALRHAAWSLAFIGLLLLPICTALLPAWPITLPELPGADALHSERSEPAWSEAAGTGSNSPASAQAAAPSKAFARIGTNATDTHTAGSGAPDPGRSWTSLALLVWMAGTLLLLLRTGIVLYRLSLVRRSARPVTDPVWRESAEILPEALGIRRPILLLQHEDVVVPMTYGVRRPVVLLPDHAAGWSDEQKHATLMHELLHVRRFDHLIHMLALAARALHWFNPLAWAAAKRLVVERERACDDGVLALGVASTSYADHLLGMARDVLSGREASAAALAMARPSELRSRIVAILDPGQPRRQLTRARSVVMAGCALMLVVLVGAVRPAPERPGEDDGYSLKDVQQTQDGAAATRSSGPAAGAVRPSAALDRRETIRRAAADEDAPSADDAAPEDDEPAVVHAADTTDVEAQKRAIHAISELPWERSLPLLREIAETHANEELRAEAIFWLGESGDASTADLLVSFARNDPSREIRKKAVFALAEMEDGRAAAHLVDLARSHESVEVREEAVFWLGEAGGPEVADELQSLARNDENEAVQKKALFALAQLDENAGVDHLIDLARSHPDPALRSEAVFWLGETGDPRAADVLMDIINDR